MAMTLRTKVRIPRRVKRQLDMIRHRSSTKRTNMVNWMKSDLVFDTVIRRDNYVYVSVTSSLSGRVYYHWYFNGQYRGETLTNAKTFFLRENEQATIECLDTNSLGFDPVADAPISVPDRRTIFWIRSLDTDVSYYIVQQNKDAGGWTDLNKQIHDPRKWSYEFVTERLVDLAVYEFRVVPYDLAGNDGTPLTISSSETIVRIPDVPDWTLSYDEGTDRVTFSEAV